MFTPARARAELVNPLVANTEKIGMEVVSPTCATDGPSDVSIGAVDPREARRSCHAIMRGERCNRVKQEHQRSTPATTSTMRCLSASLVKMGASGHFSRMSARASPV